MCRVYAENRSLRGFRAWLYADNKLTKPAQIAGFLLGESKLKIPTSQLDSYLKGLRYPSLETQERIAAALDALIIAKGVKIETSKP